MVERTREILWDLRAVFRQFGAGGDLALSILSLDLALVCWCVPLGVAQFSVGGWSGHD